MTKDLYISNYAKHAAKNGLRESFSTFRDVCEEDGYDVDMYDYEHFKETVEKYSKKRFGALKEAIFLSEDNDPRSYNDIYGDQGIALDDDDLVDGDDCSASLDTPLDLSADQISQLRSLASQILDILGPDPTEATDGGAAVEGDPMTGTPEIMQERRRSIKRRRIY